MSVKEVVISLGNTITSSQIKLLILEKKILISVNNLFKHYNLTLDFVCTCKLKWKNVLGM